MIWNFGFRIRLSYPSNVYLWGFLLTRSLRRFQKRVLRADFVSNVQNISAAWWLFWSMRFGNIQVFPAPTSTHSSYKEGRLSPFFSQISDGKHLKRDLRNMCWFQPQRLSQIFSKYQVSPVYSRYSDFQAPSGFSVDLDIMESVGDKKKKRIWINCKWNLRVFAIFTWNSMKKQLLNENLNFEWKLKNVQISENTYI